MKKYYIILLLLLGFYQTYGQNKNKIPDSEYKALVDFNNSLLRKNGEKIWKDLNKEKLPSAIVVANGHVVAISLLGSFYLKGKIPASIGRLKYVKSLDFHNVNFVNVDLTNFSKLKKLEELSFEYCNLIAIPSFFQNLIKLKKLNLLFISYQKKQIIPDFLKKLINLETLVITRDHYYDTSYINGKIPNFIGNFKKLKELNLSYNNLTGVVPKFLENLKQLKKISLRGNRFSDIKAVFPDNSNFDLSNQRVKVSNKVVYSGKNIILPKKILPPIVAYNPKKKTELFFDLKIEGLNPYEDVINSNGFDPIADFDPVEKIKLQKNGSLIIPEKYSKYLKKGQKIWLSNETVSLAIDNIDFKLPKVSALEYNALKDLYAATNGKNWDYVNVDTRHHYVHFYMYMFGSKWNLKKNDLHINPWYGVTIDKGHVVELDLKILKGLKGYLPKSFKNLKYLKKLILRGDLSKANLKYLSSLTNLEYLDLSNCNLKGELPVLAKLNKVKKIILNDNNFTGVVPKWFENLTTLEEVKLSFNKLSYLEASFAKKILVHLYGQKTSLDKLFYYKTPSDIGFANVSKSLYILEAGYTYPSSLRVGEHTLSFYDDEFSRIVDGTLVLSLYEDDFLNKNSLINKKAEFSLESRYDAPVVPYREFDYTSFLKFKELVELKKISSEEYKALVDFYKALNGKNWKRKWDINKNNLHEKPWFGVKTEDGHVVSVTLESNNLKGAIPKSFKNLKYLRKLYLGNSDLSKTQLSNLSNFKKIKYLDLHNCKLRGKIPSVWSSFHNLKELYLQNNRLVGVIPQFFQKFSSLSYMNFSRNEFTDIQCDFSGKDVVVDISQQTFRPKLLIKSSDAGHKITIKPPKIFKYNLDNWNYSFKPKYSIVKRGGKTEVIKPNKSGNLEFDPFKLLILKDQKAVIHVKSYNSTKNYISLNNIQTKLFSPPLELEKVDFSKVNSNSLKTSLTFNYPNPFNYQTTISYLSDRLDDKVVLNVYAQNGSLVLTKTIQAVKGDNKYLFTNKGLSSGVYYYTIKFSDNLNSSLKGKLFIE